MVIIKNLFLLVLTWFVGADLSTVLAIGFVSLYSARNVLYSKGDIGWHVREYSDQDEFPL